jgi:hypothetical protein
VCDLCLLYPAILVVSGLSEVLGALGQILLSYLVHMHSRLRSLRQGQVHVGPITWEVLPQLMCAKKIVCFSLRSVQKRKKCLKCGQFRFVEVVNDEGEKVMTDVAHKQLRYVLATNSSSGTDVSI